jgi:DNA-binding response OmpR family regulator
MRLLLVEDTDDVAGAIAASFGRRGDAVDHVRTVAEAEEMVRVQVYDVVILDVMLPDGSGRDVLRFMREIGLPTHVMMLTAVSDVEDRIAALDGGADDYVVKPFDLREVQARVRALARRSSADRSGTISFGDLVFDPAGLTLEIAGAAVGLTRREFSLLEIMIANRGRVVTKSQIFEHMFSFHEEEVGLNTVEIHVARLRRKLAGSRISIRTLRGLGYQIVADQ